MNIDLFAPLYPYEEALIDHAALAPLRLSYRHLDAAFNSPKGSLGQRLTDVVFAIFHLLLPYVFYWVDRTLSRWNFQATQTIDLFHLNSNKVYSLDYLKAHKSYDLRFYELHSIQITDFYDPDLDQFVNVDLSLECTLEKPYSMVLQAKKGTERVDISFQVMKQTDDSPPVDPLILNDITTKHQQILSFFHGLKKDCPSLVEIDTDKPLNDYFFNCLWTASYALREKTEKNFIELMNQNKKKIKTTLKEKVEKALSEKKEWMEQKPQNRLSNREVENQVWHLHQLITKEIQSIISSSDYSCYYTELIKNLGIEKNDYLKNTILDYSYKKIQDDEFFLEIKKELKELVKTTLESHASQLKQEMITKWLNEAPKAANSADIDALINTHWTQLPRWLQEELDKAQLCNDLRQRINSNSTG